MSKWKKAKDRFMSCPLDYSGKELISFLTSIGFCELRDESLNEDFLVMYEKLTKRVLVIPKQEYVNAFYLKTLISMLEENGDI